MPEILHVTLTSQFSIKNHNKTAIVAKLLGVNIIVSLAILEQHPYSGCLQLISSLNLGFILVFNTYPLGPCLRQSRNI
jgi:hypothetical protein